MTERSRWFPRIYIATQTDCSKCGHLEIQYPCFDETSVRALDHCPFLDRGENDSYLCICRLSTRPVL